MESQVSIQIFIFRLFMNYRSKSKFLAISVIPYLKLQPFHIDVTEENKHRLAKKWVILIRDSTCANFDSKTQNYIFLRNMNKKYLTLYTYKIRNYFSSSFMRNVFINNFLSLMLGEKNKVVFCLNNSCFSVII